MNWPRSITVLCGGVGGSRFLRGIAQAIDNRRITAVVNTGDDIVFHGLYISPDIDIVLYSLAGLIDDRRGWGIKGDTFHCLKTMNKLGMETWFALGDRDLATHVLRTSLLSQGRTPSEVTHELADRLNVRVRVIPMTDQRLETRIKTPRGWMSFQEYLVKRQMRDDILRLGFVGRRKARPGPDVLRSISMSDLLILPPSNPFVSIGTILSLPGVREAIEERKGPTVAISPIIGGKVVKGPLAKMMRAHEMEVSSLSVARMYRGLLDGFVLDDRDSALLDQVKLTGVRVLVADIMIASLESSKRLAREVIKFSQALT
ncbi:MAG TPA: 2-phospho-L-lactate transferase [Thermoproteota archaeon]|nr:2-phospho-L-lactate transferase [Thermoproteota archaeon]